MASGVSIEILDLRHFTSPMLRPVLEAEGELWKQRLHWDYRASVKLLMQYLDSHMLPGYAAVEEGQITGYAFCVYEETKAVIGDVFALPGQAGEAHALEGKLLRHLFELLQNSPQVDRIESQLLLHPSGTHAGAFSDAGFRSSTDSSWCSRLRVCGIRRMWICRRIWSCVRGGTKIFRRPGS